jgi:hypothetical protein
LKAPVFNLLAPFPTTICQFATESCFYVLDATNPEFNLNRREYNDGRGIIGSINGTVSVWQGNVQYQSDRSRLPEHSAITFQLQQPLAVATGGGGAYYCLYHHERNHGWYRQGPHAGHERRPSSGSAS